MFCLLFFNVLFSQLHLYHQKLHVTSKASLLMFPLNFTVHPVQPKDFKNSRASKSLGICFVQMCSFQTNRFWPKLCSIIFCLCARNLFQTCYTISLKRVEYKCKSRLAKNINYSVKYLTKLFGSQ